MKYATLCSISEACRPGGGGEQLRALEMAIDQASIDDPDLICLPEALNLRGHPIERVSRIAETVEGPFCKRISEKAREYSTYILCPIIRREGAAIYNSAVFYSPSGDIEGIYDKNHPTIGELESGIAPGRSGSVFHTDLGRIGVAICFDINFPDIRQYYAEREVQVVLFPSMFPGGKLLEAWSIEIGCYLVSATTGCRGAILDPLGRVLCESSEYSSILSKRVSMDFKVLHLDYNHKKFDRLKKTCRSKVAIDVSRPEAIAVLSSESEDVTVDQLMRDFSLESRYRYLVRSMGVALRMQSRA